MNGRKWQDQKRARESMQELAEILREGLRDAAAANEANALVLLDLLHRDENFVTRPQLLRSLYDDLVVRDSGVAAPRYAKACAALRAMLGTAGASIVWRRPQTFLLEDTSAVAGDLREAAAEVRAAHPPACFALAGGPPRVAAWASDLGGYAVASVARVTPKYVHMRVVRNDQSMDVVLKRERGYPRAGKGTALAVERAELDAALRSLGHEPPDHGGAA